MEALNVALGQEPGTALDLPRGMAAPPALPWNEETCARKAAESNEQVKALQAKVQAKSQVTDLRQRDYYPNIVAEASHTYVQNSYMTHPNENALSVGLSWKIFDGARATKVRIARSETDEARRDLVEARRMAANGATAAARAFQQSLAELETAQANVVAAEENLRIVQDQYKEGLIHNADVLDAESILAQSRSQLAERRYRAYGQQTTLLALVGEDMAAFYDRTPSQEK
jgi:outer membrane protein TolC